MVCTCSLNGHMPRTFMSVSVVVLSVSCIFGIVLICPVPAVIVEVLRKWHCCFKLF